MTIKTVINDTLNNKMNMTLTKKQLIILVITLLIIFTIPVVLLLVQRSQEIRPKASPPEANIPVSNTPVPSVTSGRDLCESASISGNLLSPGETVVITAKAKNPNIKNFLYTFSNGDNLSSDANQTPYLIQFDPLVPYFISQKSSATAVNTLTISYADLDKPDLNWGREKPKHIQVNVYFQTEGAGQTKASVRNSKCEVTFDVE